MSEVPWIFMKHQIDRTVSANDGVCFFIMKPQKDIWMIVAGNSPINRTSSCGKNAVARGFEGIFTHW